MTSIQNKVEDFERSKVLIREVAQKDGKLISPIDLSLDITKPLYLDRLCWINLNSTPRIMKVTNTGETVLLGAKWTKEEPCITCGPLDESYIFSQIHFHWGSHEDEGSEHTIGGKCYPMEMHVVFYNSKYLSQEAALKEDDGLVIVAYLFKLEEKSTPSLQWLSAHLEKVVEPHTSTIVPTFPLSTLVVPFFQDYILYWGSLAFGICSHTILWLVSRAPLSICVDDLNKFQRVLNLRNEPICKSFLSPNSSLACSRSVFHVNPSVETKHFLLTASNDVLSHTQTVNPTKKSTQKQQQNKIITPSDHQSDKIITEPSIIALDKQVERYPISTLFNEESECVVLTEIHKRIPGEDSEEWSTSAESSSFKTSDSNARRISPNGASVQVQQTFRKTRQSRHLKTRMITNEKERRQELEKNRLKMKRMNEETPVPKVNKKLGLKSISIGNLLSTRGTESYSVLQQSEKRINVLQCTTMEIKTEDHMNPSHLLNTTPTLKQTLFGKLVESDFIAQQTGDIMNKKKTSNYFYTENEVEQEKPAFRSKLPKPINRYRQNIKSSLGQYFASPQDNKKNICQLENGNTSDIERNTTITTFLSPKSNSEQVRKPVTKHFSRPLGLYPRNFDNPTDF